MGYYLSYHADLPSLEHLTLGTKSFAKASRVELRSGNRVESRRRSAEAGDGRGQFRSLEHVGIQQHARVRKSHDALEEDDIAEDACSGEWT